ncbi:MAG TPA: YlmC/YmxH family sporulation protein [Bacillota bacterium]|nr:YlmC/YmxH family sporulation protein [Bacillota bacterium]
MMKISELRVRDVINIADGRRLGLLCDVEMDLERGRITALIVPGPARFFGLFGRERDYVIAWDDIVKIGEDVILVDVPSYARSSGGVA